MTTDDLERDRVLEQRIALFGWIEPKHLDVPEGEGSEGFLMFAQQGSSISASSPLGFKTNHRVIPRATQDQPLQGAPRQAHLHPELLQGHLRSALPCLTLEHMLTNHR